MVNKFAGNRVLGEKRVDILKALADETRLDILRRLKREKHGASCGNISTCSSLSQPAMSHHFKKLVDAGVINESKHGTEKFYELDNKLLNSHGIDINKLLN